MQKTTYQNYMMSYLYDANVSDVIQPAPQNPQFLSKSYKLTPMLETFIILNEKAKGKGGAMVPKGRG